MLVFYTWLMDFETGEAIKDPIVTDYFVGDVGEVIVIEDNKLAQIVDFTAENFPEGV